MCGLEGGNIVQQFGVSADSSPQVGMWILSYPRETGCIENEIAAAGHPTTRLNN